jgi:hypothetical protein
MVTGRIMMVLFGSLKVQIIRYQVSGIRYQVSGIKYHDLINCKNTNS